MEGISSNEQMEGISSNEQMEGISSNVQIIINSQIKINKSN
jgi:hypothetical protein